MVDEHTDLCFGFTALVLAFKCFFGGKIECIYDSVNNRLLDSGINWKICQSKAFPWLSRDLSNDLLYGTDKALQASQFMLRVVFSTHID